MFEISAALFVDWFGADRSNPGWRVIENGWPADAKVVNVRMSLNQMNIILMVESDNFDVVGEGQMVPLARSPSMTRLDEDANSTKDAQPTPE